MTTDTNVFPGLVDDFVNDFRQVLDDDLVYGTGRIASSDHGPH